MAMEVEIKRLLDEQGHQRLLAVLGEPIRIEHQRNAYLDTADGVLESQKAMLRLRFMGTRVVATLKCRAVLAGGVSRAVEMELDVDPARVRPEASAMDLGLEAWFGPGRTLDVLDRQASLHVTGEMRTTRHVFPADRAGLGPGLWLELDRTAFDGGHVRWELECEVPDAEALVPHLDAWLTSQGLPVVHAQETKYAQFLRLRALGRAG